MVRVGESVDLAKPRPYLEDSEQGQQNQQDGGRTPVGGEKNTYGDIEQGCLEQFIVPYRSCRGTSAAISMDGYETEQQENTEIGPVEPKAPRP